MTVWRRGGTTTRRRSTASRSTCGATRRASRWPQPCARPRAHTRQDMHLTTAPPGLYSQLAVFFSAPPHDVLASRFSFDLVSGDSDSCCLPLGSVWDAALACRERVPATPNRVHFFSLKEGAPPGGADRDARRERCARGVCWVQLVVERLVAAAPATVCAR